MLVIPSCPNFFWYEFACKARYGFEVREVPLRFQGNVMKLVAEVLQPLRDRFGAIEITSGYRHKEYNRACGGVIGSRHLTGMAADFQFISSLITPDETNLIAIGFMVSRFRFSGLPGGVGWYRGFTHVDIGFRGASANVILWNKSGEKIKYIR